MRATAAATVFCITDLDAAMRHYVDVLGFEEEFRFGNYAGLLRDAVHLHLTTPDNPNAKPPGAGNLYVFCDEVDGYHAELVARGASVTCAPGDREYGLRDFVVEDPDGNALGFAMQLPDPS